MEEVHGSGVLVYLSATWLSELYQQVLACNLLEKCGYNPNSTENNALVNVLTGTQNIKLYIFLVRNRYYQEIIFLTISKLHILLN